MRVPFIDLKAQYKSYQAEIDQAIAGVFESGAFILGPYIEAFEKESAAFTGSKYAISCNSGTDALLMSLMALDIKTGDEVIVPAFSFFATAEVLLLRGIKPVFVDIEADTYNIDASKIAERVTSRTKAIIPVGLYGQTADMDAIQKIADKHNLAVIEDAAQSFGALYNGRRSCSLSTVGCTSFYPAKPLGAYGDGGALYTNNETIYKKILAIRNHGQTGNYVHTELGLNSRLDAIQAVVLSVKLKHYQKEIDQRQQVAERYHSGLKQAGLTPPTVKSGRSSVWAQYSVRVSDRDNFRAYLNDKGIPTAVHYPKPMYSQPIIADLKIDDHEYPVASKASAEIVSLPISAFLTREQQDYVIENLRR